MRFRTLLSLLVLVVGVVGFGAGPASAQDDEAGSIVEVATEAGDFTALLAALEASGLSGMFAECEGGQYTVFAPTDDAFAAFLDSLGGAETEAEDFILNQSDILTAILTYHVVEGAVPAETVLTLDGQEVETVQGDPVAISVEGESVMVNDANVIAVDVFACNGVIHVIDKVLQPPGEIVPPDSPPPPLADTGGETGPITVVAVSLIVGGGLLVSLSRRIRALLTG